MIRTLPKLTDRNIIADGPKAGRQRCCIMGCNKTFKDEGYELVICRKHWVLAPAYRRQRVTHLRRRYKRAFGDTPHWKFEAGSENRMKSWRLAKLINEAWELCHKSVRDRSMGI